MTNGKKGSASDRVRLTVDLSTHLNDELDQLAAETGRSKAELLRLGIDLLAKARDARQKDMTVGAWKENSETGARHEREFVGLP